MKILYGYGACRFRITYVDADGATGWENIDLKINGDNFPVDVEIGEMFTNIYGNTVRNITHVKRQFQVELLYNDSTQLDILNLVAKLHKNPRSFFYFYPHYPGDTWSGWEDRENQLCRYICTTRQETLRNLMSGYLGSGQILTLNIDVKDKIAVTDDKYLYIPYRDSSTGVWNSYPVLQSTALSTQSLMIGIITT